MESPAGGLELELQRSDFQKLGYCRFSCCNPDDLKNLCEEVDRLLADSLGRGGVRNALRKSPFLSSWGKQSTCCHVAELLLGAPSRLVNLTVFDKTPLANWQVTWHQDLTIATTQQGDVPGFGPWSEKEGVAHVQPPANVLQQMVAIRVHLDDMPRENGVLKVIPGSQQFGRLSDAEIRNVVERGPVVACPMIQGWAMAMSPLLLHASSKAEKPRRRRVLHFEYAAMDLPGGLEWAN